MEEVELPDPAEPWAADPGLRLARDLDRHLDGIDESDEAWERAATAITHALNDLQRTLSVHGARAEGELRHDVLVPVVRYQQHTRASRTTSSATSPATWGG